MRPDWETASYVPAALNGTAGGARTTDRLMIDCLVGKVTTIWPV
jgi:hypothetical protein